MSFNSSIEWTDTTWNPVTGCTKVSAGCDRCYAERMSHRFHRPFTLTLHPDLADPLHWRRSRRVFVNSMSDLFHKDVPEAFIDDVFNTMERVDRHVYQVLTKRSSRMRDYLLGRYASTLAPRHIWSVPSITSRERVTSSPQRSTRRSWSMCKTGRLTRDGLCSWTVAHNSASAGVARQVESADLVYSPVVNAGVPCGVRPLYRGIEAHIIGPCSIRRPKFEKL